MATSAGAAIYGFNATSPHAIRAAHRYAARRVTEVTAETKAAIKAVVIRGFRENIPPRQLARIIAGRAPGAVPLIGLHSRQAMAALNYHRELMELGISGPAITRAMAKYTRRKLAERALNIARTETMTALNYGRNAAFNTARRKGLIRKDAGKEWIITPDERLCPLCAPMAGIVVRVDKKFSTGAGELVGPPLHPQCRCTIALRPVAGGKRLSPIPQPGAPPVLPPKLPTAPKAPAPKAPSKPAPQPEPQPAVVTTTDFAPDVDLANPGIDIVTRGRHRGWKTVEERARAEGRLLELRQEAARHKKRFIRLRNVRVTDLTVDGSKALLNTKKNPGVLGWYGYRGQNRGGIHILANASRQLHADVLFPADGGIVNRSIMGAFRHEYGHAVYYQALGPKDRAKVKAVYDFARKLKPVGLKNNVKSRLGEALSRYSEMDPEEMWAEAYGVYTHPDFKPGTHMLPRRIEELMRDILETPETAIGPFPLGELTPAEKQAGYKLSEWGL